MATPTQIEANRLNAQKSTGPRSTEGKAAVRFNALKYGVDAQSLILPGEDQAQLEELRREYFEEFQPAGPVETALVETIIRADWMQRRYFRMEAEILRTIIATMEPSDCPLGAAFHHDAGGANALQKLFRRQQAAQRDWNRARAELRELQAQRAELQEAQRAELCEARRAEAEQELPAAMHPPSPNLPKREPSAGPSASAPSTPAKRGQRPYSEPLAWRL